MPIVIVVGIGGFLGAIGRHLVTSLVPHRPGETFPLGTLVVNLVGSLLLGALMAYVEERPELGANTRLFLSAGILGSFTTFSTFAFECVELVRLGNLGGALLCLGANIVLGLIAVVCGFGAIRLLL